MKIAPTFLDQVDMRVKLGLALVVAVVSDAMDYFGAALPWIGEPLDFFAPAAIAVLMDDYRPALGMVEMASIFPPAAVLDLVPTNTILYLYTLKKQKQDGRF